jgi:Protein of unknown function (DUF2786)
MPTTTGDHWIREVLEKAVVLDAGGAGDLADVLAAHDPHVDRTGTATGALLAALADVWERGWQPADVVHAVRRGGAARPVPLLAAVIAEEARLAGAADRAPAPWVDQLRELDALSPGDPAVVSAWHRAGGRSAAESWRGVLLLATALRLLPRVDRLLPPPSLWGAGVARPDRAPSADDARLLRRIRGLLAKAEATEFPEEAEALTAKAQELMTRHAVDAALLDAGRGAGTGGAAVGTRRVHVDDPYVRAKMQLLAAVADANGVRVVWYQQLGIANLVGVPADLEAVELLFTSLLLQVGQALAAAERAGRGAGGGASASRAFRRAFLVGYAGRIGERLTAARRQATAGAAAEAGVDLLPVLRDRQRAVDDATSELFPRVRSSRSSAPVDRSGWFAGRSAADTADVGSRPLR